MCPSVSSGFCTPLPRVALGTVGDGMGLHYPQLSPTAGTPSRGSGVAKGALGGMKGQGVLTSQSCSILHC